MSDEILNHINNKVDKLTEKVDYIVENIGEIKVVQARHDENLKVHMKRSDTLEALYNKIEVELEPVKEHVTQVGGVFKFLIAVSTIAGVVLGILRLFHKV